MHALRFHSLAKVGARSVLQLICALVLAAWVSTPASATTVIGDLGNFDTLNDTGQVCYGFEIEIDDIHSTDVSYTFDWNHYGVPKIREDNADPAHPKVFVRYESTRDSTGKWGANGSFTNMASPTIMPPQGHTCTDISVNEGCEHFGVGYLSTPTTIKYNWLVDGGSGNPLAYFGSPVSIAAPAWVYQAPAAGQPAQVVAAIPAPVVPIPAGKQFGEPSWVKVIKTTTHNANNVALRALISDDTDNDGKADWQNNEPDEVETEWKLLQTNSAGNAAKDELEGLADDMGDGSENVTRRYEFYQYGADSDPNLPTSIDGENGEAMCDEVESATDLHGHHSLTAVEVAEADGGSHTVDCTSRIVVGNYIGAQMAGFDAEAALGLVDHLQDGERGTPYTRRTVVVGGNTPYVTEVTSAAKLPADLSVDSATGVLSGTPSVAGVFSFTITATDADAVQVSKDYTLTIVGPADACAGVICSASDACHDVGTCDPASGLCSDPPALDGTACDDSDACTPSDTCQSGVCMGSDPVSCTASDACHEAGMCDPATGVCSNPAAPDDTACSDGNACTQSERCVAGACTGGTSVTCTASDTCHVAGTCDPATGVCSNPAAPDGTACSDGNACTQSDRCVAGACTGGTSVTCTASDACHEAGTCDPATGVCSNPAAPDGTACSDGNACTQSDRCVAGACTGGNQVTCTATDQCHVAGTCNPATGICSNPVAPNGTACNDGDICTQTDTCQAGVCTGSNPNPACASADVSLKIQGVQKQVKAKQAIEYTLRVKNKGPDAATAVRLNFTCVGVRYHLVELSNGCVVTGGAVTCSLGKLRPHKSVATDITIAPDGTGVLTCTASVSSPTPDPDLTNQSKTVYTRISRGDRHDYTIGPCTSR